jgi:hypothetical protein
MALSRDAPPPHSLAHGCDRLLAAAFEGGGPAGAAGQHAQHAFDETGGAHPLAVEGQTLEIGRLGPRSFYGELAILNEEIGGRATASVVSVSNARLLVMNASDYRAAADAAVEACLRRNARAFLTDAELVAAYIDGVHWEVRVARTPRRVAPTHVQPAHAFILAPPPPCTLTSQAYKASLTARLAADATAPRRAHNSFGDRAAEPAIPRPPSGTDARLQRKYYVLPDGFATPIDRAKLFDLAVISARKASSPSAAPRGAGGAALPPPMLPLPQIAANVHDAAARAGIVRSAAARPRAAGAAGGGGGGRHGGRGRGSASARRPSGAQPAADNSSSAWIDDPKQWDKFTQWGASVSSRADYIARRDRHLPTDLRKPGQAGRSAPDHIMDA